MYTIEQRDDDLPGSSAAIRYALSFRNAGSHLLEVRMEVDRPERETVLALPAWIPGSYKVRDFISFQGDVRAEDGSGNPLAITWLATNRLRIDCPDSELLVVHYVYYANERTVRTSHISRDHAFLNPANCLMYVEGRMSETHHVAVDAIWPKMSTALSPVAPNVWGACSYDILADSPLETGFHFTAAFERHGSMHEVAVTGHGDFDREWIVERLKEIVDQGAAMWGELPYDRYVFIIQLLPGAYGGLEHARSSVSTFDSLAFSEPSRVSKFLTLLCHEYFHLWNVKRIRPVELGPFNYDVPNFTRMLWMAEGITSYYDDMWMYRCGFTSQAGLLQSITTEHLGALLNVPGRHAMSVKDASFLSWVKLYAPSPDSHNRFPSYYMKGAAVFLLLDWYIISESDGARSLDDGMRALWARYVDTPGRGVDENEFIEIVTRSTGVPVGTVLVPWLESVGDLPVEEMAARVGLAWRTVSAMEADNDGEANSGPTVDHGRGRWTGLEVEDANGSVRVTKVWRDSPAEEAGIGAGDEIVAVANFRTPDVRVFNTVIRSANAREELGLLCATEGVVRETSLRKASRAQFELVIDDEAGEREVRFRDRWLALDDDVRNRREAVVNPREETQRA